MSSSYHGECRAAYLLDVRGTLSWGIVIDYHRNVVSMRVNTVPAVNADVLREREHGSTEKIDESVPGLTEATRTTGTGIGGRYQ